MSAITTTDRTPSQQTIVRPSQQTIAIIKNTIQADFRIAMLAAESQCTLEVHLCDPSKWSGSHLEQCARDDDKSEVRAKTPKSSSSERRPLANLCIENPASLGEDADGAAALVLQCLLRLRSNDCHSAANLAREVDSASVEHKKTDFKWRMQLYLVLSSAALLEKKRQTAAIGEATGKADALAKKSAAKYAQDVCRGVLYMHAVIDHLVVQAKLSPVRATLLAIICKSACVQDGNCTAN